MTPQFNDVSSLVKASSKVYEWHTINTWQPKVSYEDCDPEDEYGISELLLLDLNGVIIKGYFCSSDDDAWFCDEKLEPIHLDIGYISFAALKGDI